jgi:hypothetical protein
MAAWFAKIRCTRAHAGLELLALSLVLGAGCADIEAEEVGEESANAEVEEQSFEILGGAQGSTMGGLPSGAVEVFTPAGSCSGVMVGTSMVLTAAHCHPVPNSSGFFNGRISLALSGTTWRCLSGGPTLSNGKCSGNASISYERYTADVEPSVGVDLMALFPGALGTPWQGNVAHLSVRRLWTGALGYDGTLSPSMTLFGRGPGTVGGNDSGIMRRATFREPNTDPSSSRFTYKAPTDFRSCGGDSGGPYLHNLTFHGSHGYLIGTHVGNNGISGACTAAGATVYAAKFTQNKMGWISSMRRFNGFNDCFNVNGNMWEWECQ